MSGPQWYKREPRSALRGMAKLTLEQRGWYQTVQDMIYDEGGPIVDDERHLAGQMMISTRKYRAVRDALVALGRIVIVDGLIHDERADDTLDAWRKTHEAQVEGGAKGGKKRAENLAKTSRKSRENPVKKSRKPAEIEGGLMENNDLAQAKPQKTPDRSIEDKNIRGSASAEPCAAPPGSPDRQSILARCLAAGGPGLADPKREQGLHLSAPRISAALAAGCDLDLDILPVIAAKTAKARGDPITTWSYFDRAWADQRDKRLAAFAAPNPQRFEDHAHDANARTPRRSTGSHVDAAMRLINRAGLHADPHEPDEDAGLRASAPLARRLAAPGQ